MSNVSIRDLKHTPLSVQLHIHTYTKAGRAKRKNKPGLRPEQVAKDPAFEGSEATVSFGINVVLSTNAHNLQANHLIGENLDDRNSLFRGVRLQFTMID